jgi:cell division control protein 6
MFDINHYFSDFLKLEHIFNDRDVLRPEFMPSTLPHRDIEIQKIAEIVACTLKNSMPSNIFIFGKTGTGKTAVVRYVKERLADQCHQLSIQEPRWVFLNCQQVNTGYRILARICEDLDPADPIPIAGWPIDVVLEKVITKLDSHIHGVCFLVLDEIDILVRNASKNNDGILYNLARINERLKNARVGIIGISNVLNFKSQLDPRVLSSLGEEEIIFPAYNAMQLKDILEQRAELAFHHAALDSDVIPLCAALAAKEHGDARKALDLLRKAGELAERRNSSRVTQDYLYLAQDDIEKDKTREYCDGLPIQLKTVLLSIYQMQKHQGDREIITGDVYNCYAELQNKIPGLNKLTQRRVSELIRELDLSGLVNARVRSSGRYGRTKFIKMNIPIEDAYKYLANERLFSNVIEFRPSCINRSERSYYNGLAFKKIF